MDHLRPKFFYLENVPGFKEFRFDAVHYTPHETNGGIPMGGLKFVIRALVDMGSVALPGRLPCLKFLIRYQVRFGMLQAGHYGTPQRRHRFFLIAAMDGHPLPELPQPSHDFPDNYGLGIKLESSEEWIRPIRAANGTAPHPFVTIDDAISDLPRFDWCVTDVVLGLKAARSESRKSPKSSSTGRRGVPQKMCDPAVKHCGYSGVVQYHHEVKTSYQAAARLKGAKNLQHFTRTFKPEKVNR